MFNDGHKVVINRLKEKLKHDLSSTLPRLQFSSVYKIEDIVISGGCFTSLLHGEAVHDYDFFLLNTTEETDKVFQDSLLQHSSSDYLKNKNVRSVHLNSQTKEQWILTKYTDRKSLVANFDMMHCTVSYVPKTDQLFISPAAYECMYNKIMRPNVGKSPKDIEQWRIEKFINKGWKNEINSV